MSSYLDKTRETYGQIATAYAQARQDRTPILAHLEKFVALLPQKGMVLDVGCGLGFDTAAFHAIAGWQESTPQDVWLIRYAQKEPVR